MAIRYATGIGSNGREFFRDRWGGQVRRRDCTIGFDPAGFQVGRLAILINLGPKDGDFFGRFDSNFNGVSVDASYFNMDQIADDDPLVDLPR
jgi:hypothetical protein